MHTVNVEDITSVRGLSIPLPCTFDISSLSRMAATFYKFRIVTGENCQYMYILVAGRSTSHEHLSTMRKERKLFGRPPWVHRPQSRPSGQFSTLRIVIQRCIIAPSFCETYELQCRTRKSSSENSQGNRRVTLTDFRVGFPPGVLAMRLSYRRVNGTKGRRPLRVHIQGYRD